MPLSGWRSALNAGFRELGTHRNAQKKGPNRSGLGPSPLAKILATRSYCTVSDTDVECVMLPDVPVIITVVVPRWVPVPVFFM
jgi:hypothetical protein